MDDFKFDSQTLDRWLNDLLPVTGSSRSQVPDPEEREFRALFDRVHSAFTHYNEEHTSLIEFHHSLEQTLTPDSIKELTARTANVVRALWQVMIAHRNLTRRKEEALVRALDHLDARISRLER